MSPFDTLLLWRPSCHVILIMISACVVFGSDAAETGCVTPWVGVAGSERRCYLLPTAGGDTDARAAWGDAWDGCRQQGGELVNVSSVEELDWLFTLLQDKSMTDVGVWVTSSDKTTVLLADSDRNFVWVSAGGDAESGDGGSGDSNPEPSKSTPTIQLQTPASLALVMTEPPGTADRRCLYTAYQNTTQSGGFTCFRGVSSIESGSGADNHDNAQSSGTVLYRENVVTIEECRKLCESHPDQCTTFQLYDNVTGLDPAPESPCIGQSSTQHVHLTPGSPVTTCFKLRPGERRYMLYVDPNCQEARDYVCQKDLAGPGTITPMPDPDPLDTTDYDTDPCPPGYFQIHPDRKCYRIVTFLTDLDGLSWEDARMACKDGPGTNPDLASIHSTVENAVVTSLLPGRVWGMWLGLKTQNSYSYQKGGYDTLTQWTDGSNVTFTYWSDINSVTSYGDQCVEIITSQGTVGKWNSITCYSKRGYVCETLKNETTKDLVTSSANQTPMCEVGWSAYHKACYKRMDTTMTWVDAEDYCLAIDSHLASIHNDSDNAFVLAFADPDLPVWIGLEEGENQYRWTDDWPVTFTHWEAHGAEGSSRCVVMLPTGEWQNSDCEQRNSVVCKRSLEQRPATLKTKAGNCPSVLWKKWGESCYYFWSAPQKEENTYSKENENLKFSWTNAQLKCKALGGRNNNNSQLVSIHSYQESFMIVEELKSIMQNYKKHTTAWIGLIRNGTSAEFTWTDGSPLQYTPWSPGEPNSPELDTQCGEIRIDTWAGSWNDHNCGESAYFVCKTDIGEYNQTTQEMIHTTRCPSSDWVEENGHCYLFETAADKLRSWNTASEMCKGFTEDQTSHLVTIHDQYELEFVRNTLVSRQTQLSATTVWIGMYKKGAFKTNPYLWADDSRLVYQNWADAEPNDRNGVDNCVHMETGSGDWYDSTCTNLNGYVCKSRVYTVAELSMSGNILQQLQSRPAVIGWICAGVALTIVFIVVAVVVIRVKGRRRRLAYSHMVSYNGTSEVDLTSDQYS